MVLNQTVKNLNGRGKNMKKIFILGIITFLVFGSGCVNDINTEIDGSNQEKAPIMPIGPDITPPMIPNGSIRTPPIMPNLTAKYNETELQELANEAVNKLSNYSSKIEKAVQDNNNDELKTNSQYLEEEAGKYISEIEKLEITDQAVTDYRRALEYVRLAGERCKQAVEYYERDSNDETKSILSKCSVNAIESTNRLNQITELSTKNN